jgi:hypothetical protein
MIRFLEVRLIPQRQHTADDWVDVVQVVPHLDSKRCTEFGTAEPEMQVVDRSVLPRQLVMMSDEELQLTTQMAKQRDQRRPQDPSWP